MRLPFSIPCALLTSLAFAGAAFAQASASEGSVTYRCPGNDYKNTISAKEAEKLGCKKLEGVPITVIQTSKPRSAAPSTAGSATARVDPAAQRARDSDARRILEQELRTEEDRLAALKKEFNNGQPERQGGEKNYQTYVDRVAQMSAAIARKEADIAAIKREIQKLPPPPPQPIL
jgi:chromosome segregation ATPase